jgi:rare lipoprotein A (peptidoglycan hydrolase)
MLVVATVTAGFGIAQWQAVADANDLKDTQAAAAARSAEEAASRGVARSDASTTTTSEVTTTTEAPTTTAAPTTVPPTTAVPTTVKPATTAPRPTTTVPKPPPAPAAQGANSESGKASYYSYKAGGCAHRTLPKGTVVTVTNTANGKTTTCVVNDRGPFVAGRIIDLDVSVFTQIGSTSSGVLNVRISW